MLARDKIRALMRAAGPAPRGACVPRNHARALSATTDAKRKRRWRATQDPDRLRALNREHQRRKRERDAM
jgi:hypothetical protein